jgi:S-DNA-T family DNA segregation ATPase FtsK/SpoIIIE
VRHLNRGGTLVMGALAVVLGTLTATHLSLERVARALGSRGRGGARWTREALGRYRERRRRERMRRAVIRKHARRKQEERLQIQEPLQVSASAEEPAPPPRNKKKRKAPRRKPAADPTPDAVQPVLDFDAAAAPSRGGFQLPPLDLLPLSEAEEPVDRGVLEENARLIVERCAEFGVKGDVVDFHPGPVVTTFEFRPEPGVKYSRVTGLVDDLCLALRAESIIIDRIPGKSTVGIEVPNQRRETIFLRDILQSKVFQEHKSGLRVGLGKGVEGMVHVADLAQMPHLLIAGATGSGKSVTLNALITSLLYTATPDEVKFIMVDTKRLELGIYENIPHLITPVVTEPKKASNALRWAVVEMERRYKLLAGLSVRSIGQYNQKVEKAIERRKPLVDVMERPLEVLPFLVVIIDELADLMLTAPREVEESVTRLAQMARAVGIHLIISTQRPSVDVITGVIKANLPSRIALRVTSKVDSRTILDANGAEKLLGMGDMLFIPPRSSRTVRIHGPFLTEVESVRVAEHVKEQARPKFDDEVTADPQEESSGPGGGGNGPQDEMYDEALQVVIAAGQASTSQLQRRLRLGFARAGRLMDMLEADGIVGPQEGSKSRQVLVGPDYLEEIRSQRME